MKSGARGFVGDAVLCFKHGLSSGIISFNISLNRSVVVVLGINTNLDGSHHRSEKHLEASTLDAVSQSRLCSSVQRPLQLEGSVPPSHRNTHTLGVSIHNLALLPNASIVRDRMARIARIVIWWT